MPGSGIEELATTMVLRPLLRGLAAIFTLAAAAVTVHDLITGGVHAEPVAIASLAATTAAATLLFARRNLSLRWLRGLELTLMAAVAAYLASADLTRVVAAARIDNAILAFSHWQTAVIHCVLLVVAYGIFVPNRWQRTAMVVVPIAAIPFVLGLVLRSQLPHFSTLMAALPTPERLTVAALEVAIGTAVAILAAHLTHTYQAGFVRASVTGTYEMVEKIGSGGMGEVWLARHNVLVRPAAIKLIRQDLFGDMRQESSRQALQRFEREAQAAAALRSPHTIEIYDFGVSQNGIFFYVMEYLDGLDLDTLVQRFGPVPVERAIHFLLQTCDSIGDAHEHHLVHRDVKPANIQACRMGLLYDYVKVLDFGLVKPRKELSSDPSITLEGAAAGTPAYMAPELITRSHVIDARADLYSLGCVGYWLVTGRSLFESGTALGLMAEHVKTPPPPASQRAEVPIPPEFDRVLLRCVAKDPSERFQSARELAAALAAVPVQEPWTNERAEQWWKLHAPRG